MSADIRLETEESDSNGMCSAALSPNAYHPRRALTRALKEWLAEFTNSELTSVAQPIVKPQVPTPVAIVPSVNTCMSITSTTPTPSSLPTTLAKNVIQVAEVIQDSLNNGIAPSNNIVMNSLSSETKVDTILPEHVLECAGENSGSCPSEPMECNTTSLENEESEDQMMVESTVADKCDKASESDSIKSSPASSSVGSLLSTIKDKLELEDLLLLTDLFYLPFEHGKKAVTIMTEFNWLKSNSHLVIEHNKNNQDGPQKPEVC